MAGNVGDSCCGLDGGIAKEVYAELGILVVPVEQRAVGYLGTGRWSLCAHCFATLSCPLEYQGSFQE